jgi:hypothetical protein
LGAVGDLFLFVATANMAVVMGLTLPTEHLVAVAVDRPPEDGIDRPDRPTPTIATLP